MKAERQFFPYEFDHVVGSIPSESRGASSDLKRRVRNFLASRSHPGLRQLQVDVRGDVVTLSGKVRSFYEKQLAANLCSRVAGVLRIVDDIDVIDTSDEEAAVVG